ncbi:MAG: cytochrome c3 family protein [Planctomycetota bacterium]|nr:cytochrome c3 family protein [Planctomycetota bacterium]MDP7249185.1 cytochrome c3 family protein [Planctomycetota bacterium]
MKTRFFILIFCAATVKIVSAERPVIRTQCERCHKVEYKIYKGSVHQQAGTSCHDCHGGNADVDVKKEAHREEDDFVGKPADHVQFCGRCHEVERKSYERSPHFDKFDENYFDLLSCSTCHNYHEVEKPDYTWFDSNCALCHSADPDAMKVGKSFSNAFKTAWDQQAKFEKSIELLKTKGFFCSDELRSTRLVSGSIKNAQRLSHSLIVQDMKKYQDETQGMNQQVGDGLARKAGYFNIARSALIPAWCLLAAIAAAILRMAKRL